MQLRVACVILAAGQSRRFGSNKLLATLAGRPLLDYTLASIPCACFSQVVAVVSDQAVAELCGKYAPQVCSYQGGPQSESIRRGLATVEGADGCLFVMGDQPLCSADSIRRLLAAFQAQPRAVHRLSYQGKPSSPTLFPAALFPALMQLTGERGGMAAVGDTPVYYVEAKGPQELWDADTPEQLSQIQQYILAHS